MGWYVLCTMKNLTNVEIVNPLGGIYCTLFTDEEIKAQRG